MKKTILFAVIMLFGAFQKANAQNEIDYSLEGIGETLKMYDVISIGKFHEGLAWLRVRLGVENPRNIDEWYGYIDKKGELVISFDYEVAYDFSDGLACVSRSWNSGYIDKKGNVVIPIKERKDRGNFSEGLATIRLENNKYCYINKQDEIVINDIEGKAEIFHNGIAPVSIDGEAFYAIDKTGKKVFLNKPYKFYEYIDKYFFVRNENRKYGVLDMQGNIIIPFNYDGIGYSEGGFMVYEKSAKGWKYINTKGESLFSGMFDEARPFSDELAAVKKNDKWGYINTKGEIVIPMQYDRAFDFVNGYAYIQMYDKGYTVINKQGNQISSFTKYSDFRWVNSEGLYVVQLNDKWGYADIYGNSTFNPKTSSIPSIAASTNNQVSSNVSSITTNSSFPGGDGAMRNFIYKTLRYPVVAEENGEQGKVVVGFTVEKDGSVTNIHIKKSVSEWLDKEAKRIVSNMPRWLPAKNGEIYVKSEQTVEVLFRLQ